MAEQKGMPEILRDPVPSDLIEAIEDSTIDSLLSWATWSRIHRPTIDPSQIEAPMLFVADSDIPVHLQPCAGRKILNLTHGGHYLTPISQII